MAETTRNLLLDTVTEMESAVFRTGQVARRLLSEHPDLTVKRATCSMYAYSDGYGTDPDGSKLDLQADGLDGAHAWAQALGTELTISAREVGGHVLERGVGEADVDGVLVQVVGARTMSDDEAAAWRTQQAQAATGGEPA